MSELIGSNFVAPETVVSQFNLMDGDIVADFGAGGGFFLQSIASRIGSGRIYACEIQKVLVEKIGELARQLHLSNVFPLWCDLEEPNGIKISTGAIDVGILSNTLFQIEDKDAAVKEMGRTIRSGGKFFVIDWTDSFGGVGPREDHVITRDAAVALFESNLFVLDREFPAGSHHYGLAFRKL